MGKITQDLYRYIICHLSPSDLAIVSRVSRTFHIEASFILYRDIDLLEGTAEQIISWADAVARNPTLARLVRTLRFPDKIPLEVVVERDDLSGSTQSTLTKAFGAIVNLASLQIGTRFTPGRRVEGWTYLSFDDLKKSTFRLRTFGMSYEHSTSGRDEMISFLSKQSEIEHLKLPEASSWSEHVITAEILSPTFLPRLSVFEMPYKSVHDRSLLKFATSERDLVRFAVTIFSGKADLNGALTEVLECASQCHQSLQHFWFRDDDWRTNAFTVQIEEIAESLPWLRSFSFSSGDNTLKVRMIHLVFVFKLTRVYRITKKELLRSLALCPSSPGWSIFGWKTMTQ